MGWGISAPYLLEESWADVLGVWAFEVFGDEVLPDIFTLGGELGRYFFYATRAEHDGEGTFC